MAIYQGTSENTKLSISICHSKSRSSNEGILWQHYLPTSLTPHHHPLSLLQATLKSGTSSEVLSGSYPTSRWAFFLFLKGFPIFFHQKPWNLGTKTTCHPLDSRPNKSSLAKWVGFQRCSVAPCKPQTVTMPFTLTGCSSSRPILGQRQKSSTSWPLMWKLTDQPTGQDGQDTWSFRCLPLAAGGLNCSPGPRALSFKKKKKRSPSTVENRQFLVARKCPLPLFGSLPWMAITTC